MCVVTVCTAYSDKFAVGVSDGDIYEDTPSTILDAFGDVNQQLLQIEYCKSLTSQSVG